MSKPRAYAPTIGEAVERLSHDIRESAALVCEALYSLAEVLRERERTNERRELAERESNLG